MHAAVAPGCSAGTLAAKLTAPRSTSSRAGSTRAKHSLTQSTIGWVERKLTRKRQWLEPQRAEAVIAHVRNSPTSALRKR